MHEHSKSKSRIASMVIVVAIVVMALSICIYSRWMSAENHRKNESSFSYEEYSDKAFCVINGNNPFFDEDERESLEVFENYSELDSLGRCGVAYANVCRELMPTEPRGDIGSIKPSGWVQAKYPGKVDSNPPFLYNRCHLIAYCLTAENANENNLITGTRYMNVEGMLPFEEAVARYLNTHDAHVLYRVTPIFAGNNLVADGVLMEAYSVEDKGEGISFCVFCYNVQPGVIINYRTGDNKEAK